MEHNSTPFRPTRLMKISYQIRVKPKEEFTPVSLSSLKDTRIQHKRMSLDLSPLERCHNWHLTFLTTLIVNSNYLHQLQMPLKVHPPAAKLSENSSSLLHRLVTRWMTRHEPSKRQSYMTCWIRWPERFTNTMKTMRCPASRRISR